MSSIFIYFSIELTETEIYSPIIAFNQALVAQMGVNAQKDDDV